MGRRRYRPPHGIGPVNCRSLRCLAHETPTEASSPTERPNRWGLEPHELRRKVASLEKDNAALRERLDQAIKASRRIVAASSNSPRGSSRRPPRCWRRPGTHVPAAVQTASPPTPWPRAVPVDERDHGFGCRRDSGQDRDRVYKPKSSRAPPLLPSDTVAEEHKKTEARTTARAKEEGDGHQDPGPRAPLPCPPSCACRPGRPRRDLQRQRWSRHRTAPAASYRHRL